jgi:hypothetical protein
MKAFLVILAATIVLATGADARDRTDFSVHGGFTISSFSTHWSDVDGRRSFSIGAYVGQPLSRYLSVYGGISYIEKGGTLTSEWMRAEGLGYRSPTAPYAYVYPESQIAIDYIEIPILLEMALFDLDFIRATLVGGSYLGIRLRDRTTTVSQLAYILETTRGDIEPVGFGAIGGAGLDIQTETGVFHLGVRVSYGMIQVAPGLGKNVTWSMLAGYSL